MPITDAAPYDALCIFSTGKGYTLSNYEADEQFVETYNHRGVSVRGSLSDIVEELASPATENTVAQMTATVPSLRFEVN